MSEKKKKINLMTAEKVNILDRIKAGETRQALCNKTDVGLRKIERWKVHETTLREEAETATDPSRKRKCERKFDEVDQALGKWLKKVRHKKQKVTTDMLKTRSKRLAKDLGVDDDKFVSSNDWFGR